MSWRAHSVAKLARSTLILLLCAGLAPARAAEDACAAPDLPALALARLNAARAQGQQCGRNPQSPAGPLIWSAQLAEVARAHAQDMAEHGKMSHAGSDGRHGGDRMEQAGYDWLVWAENLGVGTRSIDVLMRMWTASPEHCQSLMISDLHEMGIACVVGRDRRAYWAMSLGAQRSKYSLR